MMCSVRLSSYLNAPTVMITETVADVIRAIDVDDRRFIAIPAPQMSVQVTERYGLVRRNR